ncbi:hypothetical protein M9Y10_014261 [Tritrichomonas musculus]|uniref:Uncharacterized protein n=1 Tax=Tritrichomonas musculus TaxID=1915356 RepID=A0ABR2KZ21_9EUKA
MSEETSSSSTQNNDEEAQAWPKFPIMKGFTVTESKLTIKEKTQYPELYHVEKMLQFLDKTVQQYFTVICSGIDRMRLTRNLSQNKISSFSTRCQNSFNFFHESIAMMNHLARILITGSSKSLSDLFHSNLYTFKNNLLEMTKHFSSHVAIKLNSTSKVQFSHLLKFKSNFEITNSAFSSALGPLQICFTAKIKPIIEAREAFLVCQMTNVAEGGAKISQLREEMQEMMERRQRLEAGANDLDRMFEILIKFKDSIKYEEEEEKDIGNPEI